MTTAHVRCGTNLDGTWPKVAPCQYLKSTSFPMIQKMKSHWKASFSVLCYLIKQPSIKAYRILWTKGSWTGSPLMASDTPPLTSMATPTKTSSMLENCLARLLANWCSKNWTDLNSIYVLSEREQKKKNQYVCMVSFASK